MKFEPRHGQVFGRIVVQPPSSAIVRPDETKDVTKFVLIDAVGPDVKDLKVGDVIVPTTLFTIKMDNGTVTRPFLDEKDVRFTLRGWTSLDEFHVQTDSAAQYVPFSDPRAAKSFGVAPSAPAPSPNGVEQHP